MAWMLLTDPATEVPVGSASPLAAPLEKLIDTDGVATEEEEEVSAAVDLWVLVGETLDCVEVGV